MENATNELRYNVEELAELSGAKKRRILEWHRGKLLVGGQRVPVPGKQGPGELRFPADALGAVRTLVRCFPHTNAQSARIWLWLEGYERIQLDIDTLMEAIYRWRDTAHRDWQAKADAKAKSYSGKLSNQEALEDVLWSSIGTHMQQVTHESIAATRGTVALVAAALGMPEHWWVMADAAKAYAEERGLADAAFGEPNPYRSGMFQAVLQASGVRLPESLLDQAPVPVSNVLESFNLDSLEMTASDWAMVRRMWQSFCELADTSVADGAIPSIEDLRSMRLQAYRGNLRDCVLSLAAGAQLLRKLTAAGIIEEASG